MVRAIFFSLHNGFEVYRTDWQAIARSQNGIVFGTLIRWKDIERIGDLSVVLSGITASRAPAGRGPASGWPGGRR